MHVKRNALHDVLPRDVLLQSLQPSEAKLVGPTFAAARGAVEPAKRVMEAREEALRLLSASGGEDGLVGKSIVCFLSNFCILE